jgi:hypothetical protein
VASRERKRAERRKRKQRGADGRESLMSRGYAKAEERNRAAREALEPLGEGERPTVVTVGAIISALVAASIPVGYAAGVEVDGDRPELVQVLAPTLLFGLMAWGMWRARYWAVLGFQVVLLFLLFSAAFGLAVQAASAVQVIAQLALLAVAGTFFVLMVKAMARIQMPSRMPRE